MRLLSQKTIVEIIRALRAYRGKLEFKETLYERNFPHWFVIHAESQYGWDWQRILIDLRSGTFFYSSYSMGLENITGEYLNDQGITVLGESLIQGLAAFATMLNRREQT